MKGVVTARRATTGNRVRLYYRRRNGDLVQVEFLRRVGPNVEVKLEDGRRFLVDPATMLYTSRKAAENGRP